MPAPQQNGALVFEPHNLFGGADDYGYPWPFGYIGEGVGQPVFELGDPLGRTPEELLAFANLFAAAPDMAKALEAAEKLYLEGILNTPNEEIARVHSMRRAALAKARGEA